MERREDFVTYERYKQEREQRMFDESFYIVDTEDATQEELDDLRMIITIIFNHFAVGNDSSKLTRKRQSEMQEDIPKRKGSGESKLFDDQQIVYLKRADKLFSKASLRDLFLKECIKKFTEKRQMTCISQESFANMSVALKCIIKHAQNVHEKDPAKFIDLIRIMNTFYTKDDETNKYLFQQFKDASMFRDIVMYGRAYCRWSNGYKCLLKKKKMDKENHSKPQGTILNPWRVIHGIQSYIVKRNHEDDQQNVDYFNSRKPF